MEAFEIFDCAEAAGSGERAGDFVFAALVVRGRAEAAWRSGFEFDAFEESVEGKVEVQAGLLAVGDDVEAGVELIGDSDADGVIDEFGAVGFAELREVLDGELKPSGKRVTADDGGAERARIHGATIRSGARLVNAFRDAACFGWSVRGKLRYVV